MSCVAAAGLAASCWMNGRPGTPGVGAGAAGWAAAVALSASAAADGSRGGDHGGREEFSGAVHGSPNRLSAGLRPKLRSYWCDSSDTCGVYATVTDAKANGDRVDRVGRIDTPTAAPRPLRGCQPDWPPRRRFCWRSASPRAWRGPTWCPTGPTSSTCTCTSAAPARSGQPGTLYDYVYADQTPDFPLPFTYPPFAAVVFYPLHLLPFGFVAFAWQLGIIAALYGVVRISQRLLGIGDRRTAMLWTAVGIWIEPLRSTFDYGQINVLLVLAVLVRRVQHAMVDIGITGRPRGRGEADARGVRAVLRRRAAVGRGGVLRRRVLRHGGGLGGGHRRRNPLLLHRIAG